MYDVVNPSVVTISERLSASSTLAAQPIGEIESNPREIFSYNAKNSLLPRIKNASNRHSTGNLAYKRLTPVPSDPSLGLPNRSSRGIQTISLGNRPQQQAGLSKLPKLERTGSPSEATSLSHQSCWTLLPAERNCFLHERKLDANVFRKGEARNHCAHSFMGSSFAMKGGNGQEKISGDIIPDRRSSLRNQYLTVEEVQLNRSSLIRAKVDEFEKISAGPTNRLADEKKNYNSYVEVDVDDKVQERISQLKATKKQQNGNLAYYSMEDIPYPQNSTVQGNSSQSIIVAEDKDRVNRAYKHLGIPSTEVQLSKNSCDKVSNMDNIPDFTTCVENSPGVSDTACDVISLKKALDVIHDTPNLSLNMVQFDTPSPKNEDIFTLKRNSVRRPFRNQYRQDKDRRKSSTINFNRKESSCSSKRSSNLTIESVTTTYQRSQYQNTDMAIGQDIKSFLTAQRLSQAVRHPRSGRKISFSEVGDPKGHAVFCCVGMGLTRFVTAFYDDLARTLRLRLITPDRPGIGESEKYRDDSGMPLNWAEDVLAICSSLRISKFSILAHSAGAIYALATALRVPQHVEGRIHLLAPWITPSQMTAAGSSIVKSTGGQLPRSQRILKVLPARLLKVANASLMSATSSSITRTTSDSSLYLRTQGSVGNASQSRTLFLPPVCMDDSHQESDTFINRIPPDEYDCSPSLISVKQLGLEKAEAEARSRGFSENFQSQYDKRLTLAIWDAATTNANPAVDLLICLERHKMIGFRYTDVELPIIIHHGSQDTRVPVENVKWLSSLMQHCELRILDGEGHGLMASPKIMGEVLTEIAKESQTRSVSSSCLL